MWQPYKKQALALSRTEDEVLYGGSKGGGKTVAGMVWLIEPRYIKHPLYRALIIRRNADDLRDWIDRAKRLYLPVKAVVVGNPPEFRFPSGAIFRTGHLKDEDAYGKYMGHEYQKILVEELTMIPRESDYEKLLGCCRSTIPELKPQVFTTTNPGCLTKESEVLTINGFKSIKDVQIGESVASLDDKRKLIYVPVNKTYKLKWDDKLLKLKQGRGISFLVTPEHKIVRRIETKYKNIKSDRRWKLEQAQNLPKYSHIVRTADKWDGIYGNLKIELAKKQRINSKANLVDNIELDDYCELLGWFLSEGSLNRNEGVFIAQSKKKNIDEICKLIERIGYRYSYVGHQICIWSKQLVKLFSGFGNCREKFIPRKILLLEPYYLVCLFNSLMAGDGHWTKFGESGCYYTLSKQLASDVQEILLKLGFSSRINKRKRKNRKYICYEISFCKRDDCEVLKNDIEEIDYNGFVYCLNVPPYNNFLVRYNGSLWWSGNSDGHEWVKNRFIDIIEYGETYTDPETGRTRIFIQAKIQDNPALYENDQYLSFLKGIKNEELRKAWLDGCWDLYDVQGNYYQTEIIQSRKEGLIKDVPWLQEKTVETWWDLGINDPTAIGFFQQIGSYWHMIDYEEFFNDSLAYIAKKVKEKPYIYNHHWMPWDIKKREYTTGRTVLDTARKLLTGIREVPDLSFDDGINAAKMRFNTLRIDKTKCARFIKAAETYCREKDEMSDSYKSKPKKGWQNHPMDMLRYWAVSARTYNPESFKEPDTNDNFNKHDII